MRGELVNQTIHGTWLDPRGPWHLADPNLLVDTVDRRSADLRAYHLLKTQVTFAEQMRPSLTRCNEDQLALYFSQTKMRVETSVRVQGAARLNRAGSDRVKHMETICRGNKSESGYHTTLTLGPRLARGRGWKIGWPSLQAWSGRAWVTTVHTR